MDADAHRRSPAARSARGAGSTASGSAASSGAGWRRVCRPRRRGQRRRRRRCGGAQRVGGKSASSSRSATFSHRTAGRAGQDVQRVLDLTKKTPRRPATSSTKRERPCASSESALRRRADSEASAALLQGRDASSWRRRRQDTLGHLEQLVETCSASGRPTSHSEDAAGGVCAAHATPSSTRAAYAGRMCIERTASHFSLRPTISS